MIQRHHKYTKSSRAAAILANWEANLPKFVKVMPKDYKRMLAAIARAKQAGLSGDEAVMTAFLDNSRDIARVGGG
jgi:glutamate synthase (ferredoxin)